MGNIRFGVPEKLVKDIHFISGIAVAVETGTYLGQSTAILASIFNRVWTIESVPEHVEQARVALAAAGVLPYVEVVLGESEIVLREVISQIHEPSLFWLDSHWFERIESNARIQCPLLAELSIIKSWFHASRSWLLIDDVSLFRQLPKLPDYRPKEWPTVDEITDLITDAFPGHTSTEIEDVLIVAPMDYATKLASLADERQN
jgi:hypothetical protein